MREEIDGQIVSLQRRLNIRPSETSQTISRLNREADREIDAIRRRTMDDIAARRTQGEDEVRVRRDQLSNTIGEERDHETADIRALRSQLDSARRERTQYQRVA
jgi:hypothetical protein